MIIKRFHLSYGRTYVPRCTGTVTRGVITQVLSYCAGTTESHIRASGRGRRGRGAREKQGEYTSSCTYKALASVYITYVVQFHDVSLQFRRRIFHHYPYFSPRVSSTPRSSYPLPPSQFLSPSLSLPRKFSLSPSRSLFSGFRDGAPLCEPRQIGNIFSRNTAAVPASTRRNILGDNGISGRTDSLLNIRFSVHTTRHADYCARSTLVTIIKFVDNTCKTV